MADAPFPRPMDDRFRRFLMVTGWMLVGLALLNLVLFQSMGVDGLLLADLILAAGCFAYVRWGRGMRVVGYLWSFLALPFWVAAVYLVCQSALSMISPLMVARPMPAHLRTDLYPPGQDGKNRYERSIRLEWGFPVSGKGQPQIPPGVADVRKWMEKSRATYEARAHLLSEYGKGQSNFPPSLDEKAELHAAVEALGPALDAEFGRTASSLLQGGYVASMGTSGPPWGPDNAVEVEIGRIGFLCDTGDSAGAAKAYLQLLAALRVLIADAGSTMALDDLFQVIAPALHVPFTVGSLLLPEHGEEIRQAMAELRGATVIVVDRGFAGEMRSFEENFEELGMEVENYRDRQRIEAAEDLSTIRINRRLLIVGRPSRAVALGEFGQELELFRARLPLSTDRLWKVRMEAREESHRETSWLPVKFVQKHFGDTSMFLSLIDVIDTAQDMESLIRVHETALAWRMGYPAPPGGDFDPLAVYLKELDGGSRAIVAGGARKEMRGFRLNDDTAALKAHGLEGGYAFGIEVSKPE